MIFRILAIALNTYRELIRQKVIYTIGFFAVVLILFSYFLGQLSLGADIKVIKDVGLASMMLFGMMTAIFMGIDLIYKEVDRKTIYTILSKPVQRYEFIIGKFLGLSITIGLQLSLMFLLHLGLLSLYRNGVDLSLGKAVLMIYFELSLLVAAALLFSSYSSRFMSMLFSLGFLIVGHSSDEFAQLVLPKAYKTIEKNEPGVLFAQIIVGIGWLLDKISLDHLSINSKIVHGVPVSWGWILNGFLFSLGWISVFLFLSTKLFSRKDFK